MEATMTAHEIFADTRAENWPNHLSDVLQPEMWMLQNMDFKTDVGDVLKWFDFICDSPHIMKAEGSRSRAYWKTRERNQVGSLWTMVQNNICAATKKPWAMATMVYMQAFMMVVIFRGLGGEIGQRTGSGMSDGGRPRMHCGLRDGRGPSPGGEVWEHNVWP